MNAQNCEVIQDLLPLYIDNICSGESRRMVLEHMENCEACRLLHENMLQSVAQDQAEPELDSKLAFHSIHHKWMRKKLIIICVSVFLTALLSLTAMLVFQNVHPVHKLFDPTIHINLRNVQTEGAWQRISFGNEDTLEFDSVFYSRTVVLDGNSDGEIGIRFCDTTGANVLAEGILQPGTSMDLDMLQRNTEYIVEIKADAGFLLLTFC